MNQFGWNLEHSAYIVGGWPWQILGAIRAVATVGEPGEIFCRVSNARFHRFPVGNISRKLNITRWSVSRWKLSEQNLKNFTTRVALQNKRENVSKMFNVLRVQAAVLRNDYRYRKFTTKITLYGISSFHFYRWNQLKVIPLDCTLRTRNLSKFSATSDAGWQHGR